MPTLSTLRGSSPLDLEHLTTALWPEGSDGNFSQGPQLVRGSRTWTQAVRLSVHHVSHLLGTWVCSLTALSIKGPKIPTATPETEEWAEIRAPGVWRVWWLRQPLLLGWQVSSSRANCTCSFSFLPGLAPWGVAVSHSLQGTFISIPLRVTGNTILP